MTRVTFLLGWITAIFAGAVTCSVAEPIAEAKAKIADCIEKEGDEYIAARNWLIEHPEALEVLREDSWKERWLMRICRAWIEDKDLCERAMKTFEVGEINARRSVSVVVPDAVHWADGASRNYGAKGVPLGVECLWKTGRNWRKYKAWRVAAVVEYLKLQGDASVLDPAIDVLASQSWDFHEPADPGSEYPRMDPGMMALAHLIEQMAPCRPAELILTFGDESTLRELRNLTARPETADTLKKVLNTTISLLEQRLEAKRRGQPVEKVGPHDLYPEFGDATTLENMRRIWSRTTSPYAEKFRRDMAKLERRLQEEEKAAKPD